MAACDVYETSLPLDRDEVIGQYRASYLDDAEETITLRTDSTYEHSYEPDGDSLYTQTGTWTFTERARGDGPRVRFKDFVNWYAMDGNCYSSHARAKVDLSPRGWMPYIKKLQDGTIRISRCPSNRQYYILER